MNKGVGCFLQIVVAIGAWIFLISPPVAIAIWGPNPGNDQFRYIPWNMLFAPILSILIAAGIVWILKQLTDQRLRVAEENRSRIEREKELEQRKKEGLVVAAKAWESLKVARLNQLSSLNSQSEKIAAQLPNIIREADRAIDLAENEFNEGVFPTFWDAVEVAVLLLRHSLLVLMQATCWRREHWTAG